MIKIINKRARPGALFHYAHFICDCLFPEIMCDMFNYKEVVREKIISQTIGNFSKMYTEIMQIKNTELLNDDFNKLKAKTIHLKIKEQYQDKLHFDKFRDFIFGRYNVNPLEYDTDYPEVLLIKRGDRINLIDDEYLKENVSTWFQTNGKERREIKALPELEHFLENNFKHKFKSVYFEGLDFKEQIKYFNNAKLIICAHGAVMSNMFFCKEGTTILEVTCGRQWIFFDTISNILKLNHKKCLKNNFDDIIKHIKL